MNPLLLATCLLGAPANPNPWQEVDESNGITVWAREVPSSSIREVKAEAIVNLPMEQIWAVLRDVTQYVDFMPYVVEAKVLGPAPGGGTIEYQLLDPPLVDKRDYALTVTLEHGPTLTTWRRRWSATKDQGPPLREGVVRLTICEGAWTLERLGSRSTRVEYYLYTDPGGSIPAWMANKANTTSVPTLLDAVRQRAADPTWRR
jgi:ribosome-associated toxin RatA of RatAB toxin-antitoxin module